MSKNSNNIIFMALPIFLLILLNLMTALPTLYAYYTSGGIRAGLSANQPYFTLNHRNITIFSGAMHYFRVPQEYWRDRLRKMRAAGLNAIETYIPWNLHEPMPGYFDFGHGGTDFQRLLNIELFLRTVREEDLFVILRPGPYICAEWEFGGLPSWLLREYGILLRSSNKVFMTYVARYFSVLFTKLFSQQFTRGGPIIAFQIENEYGSLKRVDRAYLEGLKLIYKYNNIVELLFTSDGPSTTPFGVLAGVLATGNFQLDPEKELKILKSYQKNKPLMVMEYWTGWFDHWGDVHNIVSNGEFSKGLERILAFPSSVNLYMFHGGTNFGFMNGANLMGKDVDNRGFQPDTTSYDYDAPLNEAGDYTEKYYSTQYLIYKFNRILTYMPPMPELHERRKYPDLDVMYQLSFEELIQQIQYPVKSKLLIPMELLPINNDGGQSYGYIIYRKFNLYIPAQSHLLIEGRVCDTLMVLINGALVSKVLENTDDLNGFGYWKSENSILIIENEYLNATLDLVVENWGRSNFGKIYQFMQYKGLWQGNVSINHEPILDWDIYPLEFKTNWTYNLYNWHAPFEVTGPALYKTYLELVDRITDSYIDMRQWNKGIVIVNGFVLCRHFKLGPQQACYLPAPFLFSGRNEILIFEHFEAADIIMFSKNQIYENIEMRDDIFSKTLSIYINKK